MATKMMEHDPLCRICKENKVNHTKWICTPCSKEALKYFKFREGFDIDQIKHDE